MNPEKRAPKRGPRRLAALAALGAALALGAAEPASAHVHWSVGIGIGAPGYWGPGYWGPGYGYYGPGWWPTPSYYYAPPTVVVPAYQPPVVYEAPRPLGPPPQSFWYYCQNPAGYYPSVPDCPGGWTPVPARPAPASPSH